MNMCSPFYIYSLVIFLVKYSICQDIQAYSIPEPKIEVFPKGFRVSIPDQDGINLFAFHGNINIPMEDLEAGQYSRDILKQEGGHWVFENKVSRVMVGDVIYYWLFVIRYNLGYRYDHGKFVVKNIIQHKSPEIDAGVSSATFNENNNKSGNWYFEPLDDPAFKPHNQKDSSITKPQILKPSDNQIHSESPSVSREDAMAALSHKPVSTCCQLFLNLTNQLTVLSERIDYLTEENDILFEIAQKEDHYATTLKVFGKYNTELYPTPKDFVKNLISEQMKLPGIKVVEANKIPDIGINFKVETLKDKVKIILARARLNGSNYDLSW